MPSRDLRLHEFYNRSTSNATPKRRASAPSMNRRSADHVPFWSQKVCRGADAVDDTTPRTTTGTTTIREAVGIFHDADALNAAVSDLISAGVDRAELSLMAQEGILEGNLAKPYGNTRQAEDDATAPRQPVYADTDVRSGRTLLTSMASVVAAFAASGVVVLTGGAALAALAAAIGAGGGAGAVGALVGKRVGDEQQRYLEAQLGRGGILLWVKITDPSKQARICAILSEHAADDVHLHDLPVSTPERR
jgi:hypothetical protein